MVNIAEETNNRGFLLTVVVVLAFAIFAGALKNNYATGYGVRDYRNQMYDARYGPSGSTETTPYGECVQSCIDATGRCNAATRNQRGFASSTTTHCNDNERACKIACRNTWG